jgi:hypothetical protein
MKGLTVGERLIVCTILPKESSFVTLRVVRNLISKLGLTAKEIEDFEISVVGEQTKWNGKGSIPVNFEFDQVELDMIKKQLRDLDEKGKLNIEMFSVYEKFV